MSFPHYHQPDEMACGATCLRMVAKHYGKSLSLPNILQLSGTTRKGANLQGLSQAAETISLRTLGVKIPYNKLVEDAPLPCIAHWNQNHLVVLYKIKKDTLYIADPAHGLLTYSKAEFLKYWVSDGHDEGVLLLLEPTPAFYTEEAEDKDKNKHNFSFLYSYLLKHQKAIVQLFIGLMAGSVLQLIFPFLTKSIIDIGVQNKDLHFIYLILLAQLMVFFGRMSIEVIRNYILMHVSSRINIALASDFFVKLMKLPIRYFDTKMTGDIMQRISDKRRIESFLTTFFLFFSLVLYSQKIDIKSYINFHTLKK